MKITVVQIIPIKANNGLIAFGSILLDDSLFLGAIGIHKKLNGSGYRIPYPTKKIGDKDINIFHPINKETGKFIEDEIVKRLSKLFA